MSLLLKVKYKEIDRFLSRQIFTWHLGSQYLNALKFLSQGAVKGFLNVRNLHRCIFNILSQNRKFNNQSGGSVNW